MKGAQSRVIRIVTDSTADLPAEWRERVHVVPLSIHFGEKETYRDGVDLDADGFYDKLTRSGVLPHTSQPSPHDFEEAYRKLDAEGAQTILSYHISSKLSGTYRSAVLGAGAVDGPRIEAVDTGLASVGTGLLAMEAFQLAEQGASADEILAVTAELQEKIRVFFLVETLEYLAKNGRIGRAQALAGGLLQVKPILTLEDGVVTPLEKARGRAKALRRLIERSSEALQGEGAKGFIVQARALAQAEELQAQIAEAAGVELPIVPLGPTVGAHVGPGALGVIACAR